MPDNAQEQEEGKNNQPRHLSEQPQIRLVLDCICEEESERRKI